MLQAQWRGVGPTPCIGPPDIGNYKCPATPGLTALRAGKLFDSKSGKLLTRQVVLIMGDRIMEVGPESQVKIPNGAHVVDLSQYTVLPGLIDAPRTCSTRGGPRAPPRTRC